MNKVPKPISIFIFLLFLLFFAALIPSTLHIAGIHCNTAKEPVKTNAWDFSTNIAILYMNSETQFTDATLDICDVYPEKCGKENECYFFAQQLDSGYYIDCNTTNNTECRYYLKDGDCHNCTYQKICFLDAIYHIDVLFMDIPICGNWETVCLDDAYYRDFGTTDFLVGCSGSCSPPKYYIFNITDGKYHCGNSEYCGASATKPVNTALDEKLLKAGSKLLYPQTGSDKNYKNLVQIKCDGELNPQLTIYGLEVFNYKIWIFLIVIYILVVLLMKLNRNL